MSVSKEIFQCYLWIDTGEEHPDTITKQTRIKPSKIYIKGDKGNSRFFNQNVWELHSAEHIDSSYRINQYNDAFEDIFKIYWILASRNSILLKKNIMEFIFNCEP